MHRQITYQQVMKIIHRNLTALNVTTRITYTKHPEEFLSPCELSYIYRYLVATQDRMVYLYFCLTKTKLQAECICATVHDPLPARRYAIATQWLFEIMISLRNGIWALSGPVGDVPEDLMQDFIIALFILNHFMELFAGRIGVDTPKRYPLATPFPCPK